MNRTLNDTLAKAGKKPAGMDPWLIGLLALVLVIIIILPRFAFQVRKEDLEKLKQMKAQANKEKQKAK